MSEPASPAAGVFIIDKPTGLSSHDVVYRVRTVVKTRRVGHAGTPDPAASGVLVVAFGPATRFIEYVSADAKAYDATVRLGIRTDTFDLEGAVLERADASAVSELDVRAALAPLEGTILQLPPMYSAVKVDGEPLYRRARRGDEVLREPRQVTVSRLELVRYEPPDVWLKIACSKGTYVRALADSLGEALGCGAVLAALRRTRSGRFTLYDAVALDAVAPEMSHELDYLLGHLIAVTLTDEQAARFRHGGRIALDPGDDRRVRVHGPEGLFLGVGRRRGSLLQPDKVFPLLPTR